MGERSTEDTRQAGALEDTAFEATAPNESTPGGGPAAGTRIGRFVVLERLGEGAMGLVLAAYDPDLDRKVALKLLKPAAWGGGVSPEGRERMLREARAMAKVSHPHVLTVHEVGTFGDQVFLAMEFVSGGTLRSWCAAEARSFRDVVKKFAQAGRGLWAAHQAGLVHRDFKPENVLVTGQGEVRVADFGLVGMRGLDGKPASGGEAPPDVTLTQTGTVMGTPAYMAPEQHAGKTAGPAADQFAFSVALWEALYGGRPFAGESYGELARNVMEGHRSEPPAEREVPGWMRDVLAQSLRPRPEDRWPSMEALLEALERDPEAERRRRLRRHGVVVGMVALAALAGFGLYGGAAGEDRRCQGMEASLDHVWDDERKAAVREAFLASGRHYAEDTYARVAQQLDAYTSKWVAARTEACEATHVRGEQSDALLDMKMACLDRRLAEAGALVEVFTQADDAEVVDKAVAAAFKLAPLEGCADAEALRAAVPPPADQATRDKVERLRLRLAQARALDKTGKYAEGQAVAQAAAREATLLGYAPVVAESLFWRAQLEEKTGDPKAAEETLKEAVLVAADARDDELAARLWADLVFVVGHRLGKPEEALELRPAAEASLRRAGRGSETEATLLDTLGSVFYAQGRYGEAENFYRRSVAIREKAHGPDQAADSVNNLASAISAQGRYEEAREHHERAHAIRVRSLGPEHPRVADSLNNLANVYRAQGAYEEARQHHERALTLREKALGPDHPNVAMSLNNLGEMSYEEGRHEEARRHYERALAIWEKNLGPNHRLTAKAWANLGDVFRAQGRYQEARQQHERALHARREILGSDHPEVATSLNNLGHVLHEEGRHDDARRHYEQALAIWEDALGPDHPDVALSLNNLGEVCKEQGRYKEARRYYERALAIWQESLGPDHPYVAYALTALAEAQLSLGRRQEAQTAAERAVRIHEAGASAEDLAESRFVLARTLWALRRARGRALKLARQAREGLIEAGPPAKKRLAEIEAWLRARGATDRGSSR